ELDLREAVAILELPRLVELLIGEVEADHVSGRADLARRAEDVRPGAGAEIEHPLAGRELGEVEVVADAGERRKRLRRNRVEQVAGIAEPQREPAADLEV